jgi:hypothetical protein
LRNYDADDRVYPNYRVVKKLVKYYKDTKGNKRALISIFEYLKNKTQGSTLYFIKTEAGVESRRIEKLIYRKD